LVKFWTQSKELEKIRVQFARCSHPHPSIEASRVRLIF
jgi:hypothetical protein